MKFSAIILGVLLCICARGQSLYSVMVDDATNVARPRNAWMQWAATDVNLSNAVVAVAPAGDGLLVAGDAPARTVKPYLLDLESTNGTFLNGRRVEPARYIELRPRDVLRMGTSSREFVLLYDEMAAAGR